VSTIVHNVPQDMWQLMGSVKEHVILLVLSVQHQINSAVQNALQVTSSNKALVVQHVLRASLGIRSLENVIHVIQVVSLVQGQQ